MVPWLCFLGQPSPSQTKKGGRRGANLTLTDADSTWVHEEMPLRWRGEGCMLVRVAAPESRRAAPAWARPSGPHPKHLPNLAPRLAPNGPSPPIASRLPQLCARLPQLCGAASSSRLLPGARATSWRTRSTYSYTRGGKSAALDFGYGLGPRSCGHEYYARVPCARIAEND